MNPQVELSNLQFRVQQNGTCSPSPKERAIREESQREHGVEQARERKQSLGVGEAQELASRRTAAI